MLLLFFFKNSSIPFFFRCFSSRRSSNLLYTHLIWLYEYVIAWKFAEVFFFSRSNLFVGKFCIFIQNAQIKAIAFGNNLQLLMKRRRRRRRENKRCANYFAYLIIHSLIGSDHNGSLSFASSIQKVSMNIHQERRYFFVLRMAIKFRCVPQHRRLCVIKWLSMCVNVCNFVSFVRYT